MGMFDDLIPGGAKKASGGKGGLTNPDRTVLNAKNEQAQSGYETQQEYEAAKAALARLKPGPIRGVLLDAAIPDQQDGILGKISGSLLGTLGGVTGLLPPQDVTDFQRLKGLQSQRVLQEQLFQKGPQTDSDAARLQLTEISPYKKKEVNDQVIKSGEAKAQRAQRRAPFYSNWAQKYGLNGVNEQGQSVEQAFQASLTSNPVTPPGGPGPSGGLSPGWKVKR